MGAFHRSGISEVEYHEPHRKRIICMAITSEDGLNRGRPSSWSGLLDELASGYSDDRRRLIIVSGGNVRDPADWKRFPDANFTCEIHDPAQAWNALTVGAYTEKIQITDTTLASYSAIAEAKISRRFLRRLRLGRIANGRSSRRSFLREATSREVPTTAFSIPMI